MSIAAPDINLEALVELSTLESVDILPYEEDADPNRRTHIINPPMNTHIWRIGMSSQDVVDIARATNQEVVALCGFKWVPKHNPEKFDICDKCMKVAGDLMRANGE